MNGAGMIFSLSKKKHIPTMLFIFQLILVFMTSDQPRQVLIFYKEESNLTVKKQLAEFEKYEAGMKERDIKVRSFKRSAETADQFKKWKIKDTDPFTFILIGRDGGEKYRSDNFVSHQDLFGKIDAMPMRRSEVGRN